MDILYYELHTTYCNSECLTTRPKIRNNVLQKKEYSNKKLKFMKILLTVNSQLELKFNKESVPYLTYQLYKIKVNIYGKYTCGGYDENDYFIKIKVPRYISSKFNHRLKYNKGRYNYNYEFYYTKPYIDKLLNKYYTFEEFSKIAYITDIHEELIKIIYSYLLSSLIKW